FNRKFWMSLEMPATLATEGIVVNYDVVTSLIVVKPHGIKRTIKNALNNLADVVSVRSDPTRKVLEELASEVMRWAFQCCWKFEPFSTEFLPQINDFNPIELEVCKILSQNMEEWHSVQKKKLEVLQTNFTNLLLDHSAKNLSLKLGERVRHDPLGAYTKFGKKDHNVVCEHLTNLEILTRRVFQEECKTKITTLVDGKFRESKQTINEIETRLTSEIVSVWSLGQKSTIKVMFEKSRENTAFDKLRNQWKTEAYLEISKTRLRAHADQIIEAKWSILEGCTARYPTCDSKCEDIKGTRYTHHTSAHVITAFGGYRYVHSRETGLVVCSEKAAHELRWKSNNIDQFLS
ncbi:9751_t:CDS:2, partial [Ambispora gerdemannii]